MLVFVITNTSTKCVWRRCSRIPHLGPSPLFTAERSEVPASRGLLFTFHPTKP